MSKTRNKKSRKGKARDFKMKAQHKSYFLYDKEGRRERYEEAVAESKAKHKVLTNSALKAIDTQSKSKGFLDSIFGRKEK